MKTWKKISSKKVYECPFFTIFEDSVKIPDGSKSKYYYRKVRSAVGIVPYDGKKIYLVNQFRYVLGKRIWELPMGASENNNFLAQAKKELKEETGIQAKNWKYLGSSVPTPSSANNYCKIFLATSLKYGNPEREGSETDMEMKAFNLKEIDQMIISGKIVDSPTIAAIHLFKLKTKLL